MAEEIPEAAKDRVLQPHEAVELYDAEVDRILSMSDAEIVAEVISRGEDPHAIAERMRRVVDAAIAQAAIRNPLRAGEGK